MSNNTSDMIKKFSLGGIASCMAVCITHPIDLLKVRLQLSTDSVGVGKTIRTMIVNEGPLSFYNGLSASLLRQATYSTARFGFYEVLKGWSVNKDGTVNPTKSITVAAIAGACNFFIKLRPITSNSNNKKPPVLTTLGGVVGCPADVTNVRMQADGRLPLHQRREYKHAIDGLIRIAKEEGGGALFSGLQPMVVRAMIMNTAQLVSYDLAKQTIVKHFDFNKDSKNTHFTASIIAAGIAVLATNPVDVIKSRMMNSGKDYDNSTIKCITKTFQTENIKGFYKGTGAAFVRLAPQTVLTFIFLEKLREIM